MLFLKELLMLNWYNYELNNFLMLSYIIMNNYEYNIWYKYEFKKNDVVLI